MHIEIPYEPRELQLKLHNEMQEKRWGVVVCHRRFGKTVWAINHILRSALMCDKPNPRLAYMAPTYRQAKNVAWDYIKQFAGKIPGVKFHETELRCDLPTGARISLLGAENPDSLRGIYLDGCVMDEVADMPENVVLLYRDA
jgi:phage terminase large subunit-like protein